MPDPDRALLRGVERGEAAALEELAGRYAAPVYRYLARLCGDPVLAEDLAQEVAIALWRSLPGRRFPNARALNAWVFTIATNAFRMHYRRKRAGETSWEAETELPAGEDCDPARAAERAEVGRVVRRALERLPEPERQALLLKLYGEMRVQEIAAATGEPVGTVKWRLSRAYDRLRRILLPELHRAEDGHEAERATEELPGRRDGAAGALARGAARGALSRVFRAPGR